MGDDGQSNERNANDLPAASERAEVPGDWSRTLGENFRGRVKYTRRFQLPTGLKPNTTIGLVFEEIDGRAEVILNGQPIADASFGAGATRIDVTSLLLPRNELICIVDLPEGNITRPVGRESMACGGLTGEVYLEIAEDSES